MKEFLNELVTKRLNVAYSKSLQIIYDILTAICCTSFHDTWYLVDLCPLCTRDLQYAPASHG